MQSLITWVFWKSKPVMEWIDHTFTWPYTIKKITGDHYYEWRDLIEPGMVFLTGVEGVGSNYINPSSDNHGAIYFGRGLKTEIMHQIDILNAQLEHMNANVKEINTKIDRLIEIMFEYKVQDDICYVLESVGKGVIPTNLVKFLTTKDSVKIIKPKFSTQEKMKNAAVMAVPDLGLPYDFGFNYDDAHRYCFELVGAAYEKTHTDVKLKRVEYKIFGKKLYDVFLADTFTDTVLWEIIVDSSDS